MAEPKPLTDDELERLMADLDEGAYDDLLVPPGDKAALTRKFADLTPLDVREWAERRGIKLPSRCLPGAAKSRGRAGSSRLGLGRL